MSAYWEGGCYTHWYEFIDVSLLMLWVWMTVESDKQLDNPSS